ncbi:hypothetical protein PV04_09916 [Phialophora macrospora]|uniref:Uncharacterized protein n=1 Tax=Phialophora macrospora TaxID=1851006 RepID=A0A0D2DKZ5_9EURO|nr:hypothetical protein PV04_09916 [Phialophora macrospora]
MELDSVDEARMQHHDVHMGENPDALSHSHAARRANSSHEGLEPSTSGILSLPLEILTIILGYIGVDLDSRAGRRLYIPPSCYHCTSLPLWPVSPEQLGGPLLLCNKALHHRVMTILYQYASIVVDLDQRKCEHHDSFTNVLGRVTIRPYVQKVDLMLEPCAKARLELEDSPATSPGTWAQDQMPPFYNVTPFCRMNRDRSPSVVVSGLKSTFPGLRSLSWTVKVAMLQDCGTSAPSDQPQATPLGHFELEPSHPHLCQDDSSAPAPSVEYSSVESVLDATVAATGQQGTDLRIWLVDSPSCDLPTSVLRAEDAGIVPRKVLCRGMIILVITHYLLVPIFKILPHVRQLDLFFHHSFPSCGAEDTPESWGWDAWVTVLKLAFGDFKAGRLVQVGKTMHIGRFLNHESIAKSGTVIPVGTADDDARFWQRKRLERRLRPFESSHGHRVSSEYLHEREYELF